MASYVSLGARRAVGIADTTGFNPGNWTVSFTPDVLTTMMPYFEVYKIIIKGATGSSMDVYVDQLQWDTTIAADLNAWDPNQPLLMIPGQSLYLFWSDPVTDNTPPTATIWLRYDREIEANRAAGAA